jgi:hypothetical protein
MPTVTIDGETHDVDADAIEYGEDEAPDGLVPQEKVDEIVQKRLNRKERSLRSELKDDDAFWQEMASARGVELRDDNKPKGSLKDDEIEALKKKASKVESLEEELDQLRSEQEETRRTKLHNTVLSTVDGVKEGAKEDVLMHVERQATYDEEYGWVITDDQGDIQYEAGEPVGPDDYTQRLRETKPYLFKSTEMKNGPSDDTGGSGGKKTWSREEYEAAAKRTHKMDDETYNDWQSAPDEGRVEE